MTTRSHMTPAGNLLGFFDDALYERLALLTPVKFEHDFVGAVATIPTSASVGWPFIKKTVQSAGTPTVARVANASGGTVRLLVDATSEKQEATLYCGDELNFNAAAATAGLLWECRAALHGVPAVAGMQVVMGLQSAWIDGPDNAAAYLRFGCSASGLVYAQAYDGVTVSSVSTGITLTADAFHVFRIEAFDATSVKFFIDGAGVALASAIPFAATGSTAILQPYFSAYKASGAGAASLDVDVVRIGAYR